MAPVISKIYIYPIKSCKALEVTEAHLSKYGLEHDRVFMVIDPEANYLRTMRELPAMALIEQKIVDDELVITAGGKTLTVTLRPNPANYKTRDVRVWRNEVKAIDLGDEPAKFFEDYLGVPCRLVHKADDHVRAVMEHSPGVEEIGFQPETAFADCFPILVLSEESIQDINTHLETPITPLNFRPNLVISGVSSPFEEDTWCKVDIGASTFYFVCRCTRCDMPNIDPETGIKDKLQPQKTLQSVRRVDKGKVAKFKAVVGMNVVPAKREGVVKVGDVLKVTEVFEGVRQKTGQPGWTTNEKDQEKQVLAAEVKVAA